MSYLKVVWYIVWKDIFLEFRTREMLNSMLFFSLLVIVIFNFAFEIGRNEVAKFAPGILWVVFTFAGVLGLNRSFLLEKEDGGIMGLMLAPVDRSAIFMGKAISNFIFMLLTEILVSLAFLFLFNFSPVYENFIEFFVILFLGTLGFAVIGTLFSAITVNTSSREILLPLLFFPVLMPVIVAAVSATGLVMSGNGLGEARQWLTLMGVFDILFIAVPVLVFEYVLEE
ncbi:MAG: heme exporter protein CcmB [Thermodesulfobacteriota bacterium]